jgi:tellurite resistance protein TerC
VRIVGTPALWLGFLLGAAGVVAIDLKVSGNKEVTPRTAALWTGIWVALSLAFAGFLYSLGGTKAAVPFLTAFVIEYALSVDNLFVFLVIFSFFKVSSAAQHRLLYWGIIGAFALRASLIVVGTKLIERYDWVLYFFAAVLLYTAWKMLFAKGDDDQIDPEKNKVFAWARKALPIATGGDHGVSFVIRENGALKFTTLFLVLLVVETSDVLFAVDSIPAVLGISQDPYLVFTSNACAILGLRSLFFVVSSLMDKFRYLKLALGVILGFVGVKLIIETAFDTVMLQHEGLLIVISLGFIAVTLTVAILASIIIKVPAGEPTSHV